MLQHSLMDVTELFLQELVKGDQSGAILAYLYITKGVTAVIKGSIFRGVKLL